MPTNRPDSYEKFVEAWTPLFEKHEVHLIPVFDNEEGWAELPYFIPRQTDMIRSWGFYKAWRAGSIGGYTLTLDDDVRPLQYKEWEVDIFDHYEYVFKYGASFSSYLSVGALTEGRYQMRGFPFKDRRPAQVDVQYGGWSGVLDYDAPTQIACSPFLYEKFKKVNIPVPKGTPVTCCIMNCAFRNTFTPFMWQLPMLYEKYNRFGDIWSGLLQKKMLDLMGHVMVINGHAQVIHGRASNPYANLEREAPGIELNEGLWEALRPFDTAESLVGDSKKDHYLMLVRIMADHFPEDYGDYLVESCAAWLSLFDAN